MFCSLLRLLVALTAFNVPSAGQRVDADLLARLGRLPVRFHGSLTTLEDVARDEVRFLSERD